MFSRLWPGFHPRRPCVLTGAALLISRRVWLFVLHSCANQTARFPQAPLSGAHAAACQCTPGIPGKRRILYGIPCVYPHMVCRSFYMALALAIPPPLWPRRSHPVYIPRSLQVCTFPPGHSRNARQIVADQQSGQCGPRPRPFFLFLFLFLS